jgi:crotonobetainyl-CoA:carnitine CoA-transferase CaiB-like acyl-CoA transferase
MSERTQRALRSILDSSGWRNAPLSALQITPSPNMLPTSLPIGALASAALGATGLAAAALWQLRSGTLQEVGVDTRAATLAMTSATYLRVNGEAVKSWDPITGYYRVRDGEWVYLHGNFAHLRDGLLKLFNVPNDPAALRAALATWSAADIEDAAGQRGLCGVVVRTPATWESHPQARATTALPLIEITRIGDAPPQPLAGAARPLSDIRVLDLSRVIAGPMTARTLAEHGATVMQVGAPHLPSIESLVIDTGFGKHSCAVDLDTVAGVEALHGLIDDADIFLNAYRPGALERRGFSPAALAERRPGIVYVTISAFSRAGPWAQRRGYDTLVAAASGLTWTGSGDPARLPCQPLDYLTGYLGAFGAMLALQRRAQQGGSWHVQLSLERTSAWIREMTAALGRENAVATVVPPAAEIADLYAESPSRFGSLRHLKPVVQMSDTPARWERPPVPLGSDPALWPASMATPARGL